MTRENKASMEEIALQMNLEINLPPLLTSIIERLKQDGIYLDDAAVQEKKSAWMEAKAVEALRSTVRCAAELLSGDVTVAQAARLLEKIQVAATVAEKNAFITHTARARQYNDAIQEITHECREFFHDLKASHRLLRKN